MASKKNTLALPDGVTVSVATADGRSLTLSNGADISDAAVQAALANVKLPAVPVAAPKQPSAAQVKAQQAAAAAQAAEAAAAQAVADAQAAEAEAAAANTPDAQAQATTSPTS